ncbi:B-cell CLL/lymphoma 9-like protein isoform X2 [Lepisosteus oculatus]|uniref:B-cell CLL/lymphoma 9-like protein isoform X2 n=1 Tax=Lepisosteus oculatus TaxID=7918 RepID=UPI0035F51988
MHPDNKLTNHGKQVNSTAQSQLQNVIQQPGSACSLGSKGVGAGSHAAKANQISPGSSGLKSAVQAGVALGGPTKGKAKRERSVSADSGEQRDALTPALEPDAKEGVLRTKRRCVLEKKQPYSGDEWCSGADTDDDDKPPAAAHRERSLAGPAQPRPGPSPLGPLSESGSSSAGHGLGAGLHPELGSAPKPLQQVVYVFTTSLANSAAEAVVHGHADSILVFHQQNVPRTKLDQGPHPGVKLPGLSEQLSSGGTPPGGTPKSQSGTPRPASAGIGVGAHLHPGGTPSSAGPPEEGETVARPGGGAVASANPGPGAGVPGGSPLPSGAADGLSKEQLEHRERSLQTLRDIERLLLRGGKGQQPGEGAGASNGGLPAQGPGRRYEEPLPGLDEGLLLGPDGLSPEQAAWRRLQEEYFQEKRRQQDVPPHGHGHAHPRMMPEAGLVTRGPPPPYHSKPGEPQWPGPGAGGQGRLMEGPQDGPRGQRFLGSMQRGPPGAYPGAVLPMDSVGLQRPPRPGWLEDAPPSMGSGLPFQGCYPAPGPPQHLAGDPERLLLEKRPERVGKQAPAGGGGGYPRGDPMEFAGSRALLGSPGGGPAGDMAGSPLGGGLSMSMNVNMSLSLQSGGQQPAAPKLMLGPEEVSRLRAAQNGPGGGGKALPYPGQGPFSGYLPQDAGPDLFGPEQGVSPLGGTSRLSHLPLNPAGRGPGLGPRRPSDLSVSMNPMGSPSLAPPHHLKSPSVSQAPSPSAPGLKSPQLAGPPPPPPTTPSAGTPSLKSPQVVGPSSLGVLSPSGSPGRLKSPSVPVASPSWAASPKTTLPSPGGPPGGKAGGSGVDTGPPLPPRSSNSTPLSQPGSINPSMPFTSSPDAPPSQNPLSLIMSQMSKYAMPSNTPLYHDAIKTIATSDDEMMPDRPLLAAVSMADSPTGSQSGHPFRPREKRAGGVGNHQPSQMHLGSQSPMGAVLPGQPPLSHDPAGSLLHPPSPMSVPGGGAPCSVSPMLPHNQLAGYPRLQAPPYPPAPAPEDALAHHHQLHLLGKGLGHAPAPLGEGPDLSEVIRPSATGIPEFDLSRIIPADKPSGTLQYFPRAEPSNPHLASLQSMMAEQPLPPHAHAGLRARAGMCAPPGHLMGRTAMGPPPGAQQQLHHGPHPAVLPPQQHQHGLMVMQPKQRGAPLPADLYAQQGPLMGPPHPQAGLLGPQSLRQRGMSLDSPLGYGPSSMANLPF